jgi:hypothetical protein
MLPRWLTSCRRGESKQFGSMTPLRGSWPKSDGALDPHTSLILAVTERLEAKRDRMLATPLAPSLSSLPHAPLQPLTDICVASFEQAIESCQWPVPASPLLAANNGDAAAAGTAATEPETRGQQPAGTAVGRSGRRTSLRCATCATPSAASACRPPVPRSPTS